MSAFSAYNASMFEYRFTLVAILVVAVAVWMIVAFVLNQVRKSKDNGLKATGWSPVALPGEQKRINKAMNEAREQQQLLQQADYVAHKR